MAISGGLPERIQKADNSVGTPHLMVLPTVYVVSEAVVAPTAFFGP